MKDPFEFDPAVKTTTCEIVVFCTPAAVWLVWVLYHLLTWEPASNVFRG